MKFVRWRDFNSLRRAHASFYMTRRVVAPYGYIVYRGNCSTNGGRLIHALSNFDYDFRDHQWCVLKKFWNRRVRRCLNFISWKYHGWTLRNNKVIRYHSNRFHDSEIWKSWNFPKYWRWWGVHAPKFMKFARWRDFNALRRAHVSFTWIVEWLHP